MPARLKRNPTVVSNYKEGHESEESEESEEFHLPKRNAGQGSTDIEEVLTELQDMRESHKTLEDLVLRVMADVEKVLARQGARAVTSDERAPGDSDFGSIRSSVELKADNEIPLLNPPRKNQQQANGNGYILPHALPPAVQKLTRAASGSETDDSVRNGSIVMRSPTYPMSLHACVRACARAAHHFCVASIVHACVLKEEQGESGRGASRVATCTLMLL
jgi:hypothetical protein